MYIIHVIKQRIKNDTCSMGGGGGTAAGRAAPLLFFLSIEVAIVAEARVVTGMVVLLAPRQEPKHLMCDDIYNKKEKKKRKREEREKREESNVVRLREWTTEYRLQSSRQEDEIE